MTPKILPDRDLIEAIRSRGGEEQAAMRMIYRQYWGYTIKGQRQYRISEEQAIDAYEDAIIGLSRQLQKPDFQLEGSLGGYLYRSFCNRCVDRLRKSSSLPTEELDRASRLPSKARNVLEQLSQREEVAALVALMDKLGGKCKQLLLEAEYYGYSIEELVSRLGFKDANSLASQKYRCMKKLRELIKKKNIRRENFSQ
ncbi:MAG: sigma-70 family RNA polymerase sigma factor [Bacteroidota bacterium]